ncbi:unnamed protein product [Chrysodeixis includens]|uniref:Uncharacterized protein n=1 Tax=Chrysodeixis includens TaxID=689277 RepID=A0A9N8PYK3_CHRIL|nr:unnamed protein product [Chrysodeixis includens]
MWVKFAARAEGAPPDTLGNCAILFVSAGERWYWNREPCGERNVGRGAGRGSEEEGDSLLTEFRARPDRTRARSVQSNPANSEPEPTELTGIANRLAISMNHDNIRNSLKKNRLRG